MEPILLKTIRQQSQRYKTIGDWFTLNDPIDSQVSTINIRATKLSDWRREFLILVHELVEYGLCRHAKIAQTTVDDFDKRHEDEQDEVELGDLTEAPYRRQHCIATAVERLLAAELDVPWAEYEEELNDVMEKAK